MTEGELRKTIVVDAPPKVVFKALTDEKELVRWMPQEAKMDARVGGEYEFKYHWAQRGLDAVATGRSSSSSPTSGSLTRSSLPGPALGPALPGQS